MARLVAFFLSRLPLAACALLLPSAQVSAAAAAPSEYAVKAAFLPKFAGYVAWPGNVRLAPGAPLMLCILGDDPFGRLIDSAVRGQLVDQRPIIVRRVTGAGAAAGCHIAFVQGGARTSALLSGLGRSPILTVTDERGGPQRGMVHFVVQDGRVRFHIDEAEAARHGLSINSRLLAIALTVRQRP